LKKKKQKKPYSYENEQHKVRLFVWSFNCTRLFNVCDGLSPFDIVESICW
jgi:hypothetical protein